MIDTALAAREKQGNPVRVAMVGAGFAGRMIAFHLVAVPGIRLVAIVNRTPEHAVEAFRDAGVTRTTPAADGAALDAAVGRGECVVSRDHRAVCDAKCIDAVIEVTGTVEYGARVVLDAIAGHKHVVLVNAELDATLGPVLKSYADRAGVVLTDTDGDEPGVAMTLLRYLRSIGLRPVAAGNLKGLLDVRRTPATQKEFAQKTGQDPMKVTSFADGTKLSMEAAVLANAAGFGVGRRGMFGPQAHHVREMAHLLPAAAMLSGGGIVDYALGAEPHTGAFVVVHESDPHKVERLRYFKMGDGPFFVFYTPFHLPQVQVASTVARAVLFADATVAPLGAPRCEVITLAKRDLPEGTRIDGLGGYDVYGTIENAPAASGGRLLPAGVAEGCTLMRDVARDHPVTYDDVALPGNRLCDRLRGEQELLERDRR
ncbi:MAG TPA: NAD(P)-dependent oxidoreductase [Bacteroidota bacterium]|nr:NAD(P)-dependent oxidoreductase [Bacteroidota bacterium]